MADEYDAAQERGEVATAKDGNAGRFSGERPATAADLGLSRKEIHEARQQFVKSMRGMSDANKVDLREVNSAFSHQENAPALGYEEQPA